MKNPWVIIGAISLVLIGGAVWYSHTVTSRANDGVTVTTAVKGNAEAAVVLEEFSDFQCPACAQFYPFVKEIMDDYGDRVRFEYRHFPLIGAHPYAEPAARAAEAAGQQGKFFEFHDKLFENQAEWSRSTNPSQFFNQYAQELELDIDRFRTHQKSSLIRDHIRAGMNEGRERGITGTPTFFLNGERLQLRTIGELRTRVEAALGIEPEVPEGATTTEPTAVPAKPDVIFGI